ncbi:hypothetical protein SCOR_10220 [Sulfidibacter corallicola]|uniref:Uncharacterized protein n=1 Tax=Sulfidibacter corallicola TaxID=2818388 RepID=A0A8A4TDV3_SULCO|nr:hypothetical protein [Sulfidibacter corallicola]QTD48279.1 hypothetical protein J3U87_22090 [Sulfidibacter corallicola]
MRDGMKICFYKWAHGIIVLGGMEFKGMEVTDVLDDVNLEDLKKLYKEDKIAQGFFDIIAQRKRGRKVTDVNQVIKMLKKEDVKVNRQDASSLLRTLEKIGCGKYIPGRHSYRSRIEWDVSMISVGRAASGESEEVEEFDEDINDVESGLLAHSFHLRSDLTVEFELPVDFTKSDADRLASFIRTLPFDLDDD